MKIFDLKIGEKFKRENVKSDLYVVKSEAFLNEKGVLVKRCSNLLRKQLIEISCNLLIIKK